MTQNTSSQLDFFAVAPVQVSVKNDVTHADFGTFKDSLRAPIHRWFTYPAGFSYKAVEHAINEYNLRQGQTIYDPFAGTGTTNIVAKQQGINSVGVEAHPFVAFVARTKLFWEFEPQSLLKAITEHLNFVEQNISEADFAQIDLADIFPELILKCFSEARLKELYLIRESLAQVKDEHLRDLFKLALTNLLRTAADVATGWPYIAPGKPKKQTAASVQPKYREQLQLMYADLLTVIGRTPGCQTILINNDSRRQQTEIDVDGAHDLIATDSVELAFTSPPYLNNYDYADRTRLETYFFGEAKSWRDITEKVRTKLIMSATTQINRGNFQEDKLLSDELIEHLPKSHAELSGKVHELSKLRLTKGGKKSYDILVAGYFNDMLKVVTETYRVLKRGSSFILILGDSAPYGVYIPIDIYLSEIGRSLGFRNYTVRELRARGGKWKTNPQRHSVALREFVLTLSK